MKMISLHKHFDEMDAFLEIENNTDVLHPRKIAQSPLHLVIDMIPEAVRNLHMPSCNMYLHEFLLFLYILNRGPR
jgi:hypothetical protein